MKKYVLFAILALIFTVSSAQLKSDNNKISYANPVYIGGSDFGNVLKTFYILGDWESMMKFTSSETIKNFGYDSVLHYYQTLGNGFGYDMLLKSITSSEKSKIKTMNYAVDSKSIKIPVSIIRIQVLIENDTTKIVLPNLNFNIGCNEAK